MRYVTKSWDDGWYNDAERQTMTVLANEESPSLVDTGLIDKNGNKIMKRVERFVGFINPAGVKR